MKLRPTLVAAVIAVLAGVSTVTLAAAADNAPTAKPEVTAAPQQAETAGKTAAPNKKAKAHSHTQEKSGGPPSTVVAADTTKRKTSKVKPHQHSRDAK